MRSGLNPVSGVRSHPSILPTRGGIQLDHKRIALRLPILAAPPNDARDKGQSAPPRPSARSRLGQPTFAKTHGYGRNAPKAAIRSRP